MARGGAGARVAQPDSDSPQYADRPARLLKCRNLAEYRTAAEKRSGPDAPVPILDSGLPIQGFPQDTVVIDTSEPDPAVPPPPTDPRRVVLALEEPYCCTAARLLASRSGRKLVVAEAAEWIAALDTVLAEDDLRSLSLVVPGWSGNGTPDPSWLRRALAGMRWRHGQVSDRPWGVLTAADPPTLSLLIAKTLMQAEIAAAYAEAATLVLSTSEAGELGVSLPRPGEDRQAPIVLFSREDILSDRPDMIVDRPWNLVYFHGHGRSYCACSGYLCSARKPGERADMALAGCVSGMGCANPASGTLGEGVPAFPRIDPRRYNTPVMLMACCASGGWYDEDWGAGHTNIALLALSGSPGAVVTSDYTTLERPGEAADKLFAVGESATLGAAVAAINLRRESRDGEFPYFLLGDPECPGAPRLCGWRASATLRECAAEGGALQCAEATIAADGRFARLAVPASAPGTMIWVEGQENTRLEAAIGLAAGGEHALWLDPGPPASRPNPTRIRLERHPLPAVPPHLLAAAEQVDRWIDAWTEELRYKAGPLMEAAAWTRKVAAMLRTAAEGPSLVSPKVLNDLVRLARLEWLAGQRACVEAALTLAPDGLWPFRLWEQRDCRSAMVDHPCPYCERGPTLMRIYESPPSPTRLQRECVSCALIEDRPVTPIPQFELQVPGELIPGRDDVFKLIFQSPEGQTAHGFSIAGAILLDQRGHGARSAPAFALEMAPGQTLAEQVPVLFDATPEVPHRYYVRAVLLINGAWVVATRIARVLREGAPS